jgi:hypothetical protein
MSGLHTGSFVAAAATVVAALVALAFLPSRPRPAAGEPEPPAISAEPVSTTSDSTSRHAELTQNLR